MSSINVSLTHSAAVHELLPVNPPMVSLSVDVATVVPSIDVSLTHAAVVPELLNVSPPVVLGNAVETAAGKDGFCVAE